MGRRKAVISHLAALNELGITVVEIMPVAQFPGGRNWGYDGVYPFAAQNTYGGPEGLKHLVDACHRHGLAVTLDVVYNHLGAEGNYLWDYGPYFTDRYKTAWGSAVNFDGPHSDEVGVISFRTPSTGCATSTWMHCAWMRCMPCWTSPPGRSLRNWPAGWTRKGGGSDGDCT
jgi:hypothetical protein